MIVIENISKSYRGIPVVRDLSLTVARGEIFGLVGPNGAGKTTTIRMMTGLARPDSGLIRISGNDIVKEPVQAKSVLGYVPDKPFLYEKLTAREFLIFTASLYGMAKQESAREADHLLMLFGISDAQHDLIEGFSQGMRQRLLFAAALIHHPRALLIDEPFVGLDPFGVRMLKGLIRDLANSGMSVFLATHSLHIAEELCHKVGFIKKGSLAALRNSAEIHSVEGGLEELFMRISR